MCLEIFAVHQMSGEAKAFSTLANHSPATISCVRCGFTFVKKSCSLPGNEIMKENVRNVKKKGSKIFIFSLDWALVSSVEESSPPFICLHL